MDGMPRMEMLLEMLIEKEFFIDNLLVRNHFIIVMIRWTGLAPWEFELPFPGSLTSTCLMEMLKCAMERVDPAGTRCRANVAHIRQSATESVPDFRVKQLEAFKLF